MLFLYSSVWQKYSTNFEIEGRERKNRVEHRAKKRNKREYRIYSACLCVYVRERENETK